MRARRRFTLLELLVVVGILATLAGALLVSLDGVQDRAGMDVTQRELGELRRAVLQFRQDTGHLPKQGPFALEPAGSVPLPPEGAAWFDSPANMSQLYDNPLAATGHPLQTWDPDRRRGWRGPYLTSSAEGQVIVGDSLALDGRSGGLDQGALLPAMPALADPFARPPLASGVFQWTGADGTNLPRHGRPYLLFDLDDPSRARAVAPGADGRFQTLPATGDLLTAPGSDDVGVYLVR